MLMRRLGGRLAHSACLLIAASVLTFLIVDLAPGDFYQEMRINPRISASTIAALRSEHGLNASLPLKYVRWVRSILAGDWGFSFAYDSPAGPILWNRARNTLLLTSTATAIAWLAAIPLGSFAAAYPGKLANLIANGLASVLVATPEVVLGPLLLLAGVRLWRLPAGGMTSLNFEQLNTWARIQDVCRHLLLPSTCLAAVLLPLLFVHVRSAVSEILKSPFILACRANGIPQQRILFRHALPAASNSLISLFGFSLGTLLSSSLLIEVIFSWPGVGQLLLEAILNRDFYLVVDTTLLATVFLIAGNLFADILLFAVDPRIRVEGWDM
jgi:peptide/nickel transport system permease protein